MEHRISLIIPTYQEAASIGPLVKRLKTYGSGELQEVIVVDCGSTDGTLDLAEAEGAIVFCSKAGRGRQLNLGASKSSGDILYFLHADAFPPPTFARDICSAISQGYDFGNFRQKILSENKWVVFNSYMSRFNGLIASGGDQSLFIRRSYLKSWAATAII
ncbi:MAG: glycosyltransferase [Owenweeksia sp.]|nr:glycosyltransferase [Owenweeksia sp.]